MNYSKKYTQLFKLMVLYYAVTPALQNVMGETQPAFPTSTEKETIQAPANIDATPQTTTETPVQVAEPAKTRTPEEEKAAALQAKRQLTYDFIANGESDKYTVLPNGRVRQDPISNFYFCTAGGLTIGYGTLIPFTNGKVAPEGKVLLDKLVILDTKNKNRPLDLTEKIQLAQDLRTGWINAGQPKDWKHTAYIHPKYQKRGAGLEKCSQYLATPDSCWTAMRFEVEDKLNKLPNAQQTLFLQTMTGDSSMRCGLSGFSNSKEYAHLKDNIITLKDAKNTPTPHRNFSRELVMKLHDLAKQNAFNANDPQEQRMSTLQIISLHAIATAVKHYEKNIFAHDDNVPLKVLIAARLATVQLAENATGKPLSESDIKHVVNYTDTLVYDGFFGARQKGDLSKKIQDDTVILLAESVLKDTQSTLAALKTRTGTRIAATDNQTQNPVLTALQERTTDISGKLVSISQTKEKQKKTQSPLIAPHSGSGQPVFAARSFGVHLGEPGSFKPAAKTVDGKPLKTKKADRKLVKRNHKER